MTNRIYLLALFSAILFSATSFLRVQEKDLETQRKRFWIVKTHQDKKFDVIIYGDSRVYRGVSPAAIQKDFKNFDIINFAYSSASFSSFMMDEVEKRFRKESNNKILLLGISPFSLTPAASKDKHYREELTRKKEEILEYMYLQPVSPFRWVSKQTDEKKNLKYQYFEEHHADGWIASWQVPADPDRAIESYIKNFKTNKLSESMVDSLMMRISTWNKQNIRVFGFRPPVAPKLKEVELSSGFVEADFADRFRKAGGVWIDVDHSKYQTYDGSHLDKESAVKLSQFLSRKMKADKLRARK